MHIETRHKKTAIFSEYRYKLSKEVLKFSDIEIKKNGSFIL